MKSKILKRLLFILILGGIFYFTDTGDYMDYKSRKCLVLDKMITGGGRSSDVLYLIVKEESGIVFEVNVSPSTYSQTNIGDNVIFSLRDFDVKQNNIKTLIAFFHFIIMFVILFYAIYLTSLLF